MTVNDNEFVVQSFLPHALEFRRAGEVILTIPAGYEDRNIVIATKELVTDLMKDASFKTAYEQHLLKILDNVPVKYQDQADTIIQMRLSLEQAKNDKDTVASKLDMAASENEALKKRIAELEAGGNTPHVDLAKLAAAKEAAKKAAPNTH